jgi:hypothetical protein
MSRRRAASRSRRTLRRTFATVAEAADVSPLQLKAMINHAMPRDVTAGYVQLTVERLREPAQRVADRMKELCGIEPASGNVVKIREESDDPRRSWRRSSRSESGSSPRSSSP